MIIASLARVDMMDRRKELFFFIFSSEKRARARLERVKCLSSPFLLRSRALDTITKRLIARERLEQFEGRAETTAIIEKFPLPERALFSSSPRGPSRLIHLPANYPRDYRDN